MDTRGENVECCYPQSADVCELMTILKACSAGREVVSLRVLVLPLEMLSLAQGGLGLSVAQ